MDARRLPQLTLTVEENNRLVEWAQRHTTAQALALRARIVLACAEGATNTEVSERVRVTVQTVGKWRGRFVHQRLDGLTIEEASREARPMRPSTCIVNATARDCGNTPGRRRQQPPRHSRVP